MKIIEIRRHYVIVELSEDDARAYPRDIDQMEALRESMLDVEPVYQESARRWICTKIGKRWDWEHEVAS